MTTVIKTEHLRVITVKRDIDGRTQTVCCMEESTGNYNFFFAGEPALTSEKDSEKITIKIQPDWMMTIKANSADEAIKEYLKRR